jgi:hypothetical protein
LIVVEITQGSSVGAQISSAVNTAIAAGGIAKPSKNASMPKAARVLTVAPRPNSSRQTQN